MHENLCWRRGPTCPRSCSIACLVAVMGWLGTAWLWETHCCVVRIRLF